MKLYVAAWMFLVACGSSGSSGNVTPDSSAPADAKVFLDAPPVVPAMITISGTASEDNQTGSTPLAGVAVAIYKASDEATPLAMATSDAQGKYSFQIPTGGAVVAGFLKATKTGYATSYTYPAAPFQADTPMTNSNMVTSSNFDFLKLLGGQTAGKGLLVVSIVNGAGAPVMGATVSTTPASGKYQYTASNGTPTSSSSSAADGTGFCFNAPPGKVTVTAAKSGMGFKAHEIGAHADAFTTTLVVAE